jgi:hypothetical protein
LVKQFNFDKVHRKSSILNNYLYQEDYPGQFQILKEKGFIIEYEEVEFCHLDKTPRLFVLNQPVRLTKDVIERFKQTGIDTGNETTVGFIADVYKDKYYDVSINSRNIAAEYKDLIFLEQNGQEKLMDDSRLEIFEWIPKDDLASFEFRGFLQIVCQILDIKPIPKTISMNMLSNYVNYFFQRVIIPQFNKLKDIPNLIKMNESSSSSSFKGLQEAEDIAKEIAHRHYVEQEQAARDREQAARERDAELEERRQRGSLDESSDTEVDYEQDEQEKENVEMKQDLSIEEMVRQAMEAAGIPYVAGIPQVDRNPNRPRIQNERVYYHHFQHKNRLSKKEFKHFYKIVDRSLKKLELDEEIDTRNALIEELKERLKNPRAFLEFARECILKDVKLE